MKKTGHKNSKESENKIRRVNYFKVKNRKKIAFSFFKASVLIISIIIVSVSMSFKGAGDSSGDITRTPEENTPTPTMSAALTLTQDISPTLTPESEIAATSTPTSDPTEAVIPTLKPTFQPTVTPIPTKASKIYVSGEVRLNDYGEITIQGMSKKEFETTLVYNWQEVTVTGKYVHSELDLYKKHSYADLVTFMENLSRHEAVKLFIMGKSKQGRNIYHIEVDFITKNNQDEDSEYSEESGNSEESETVEEIEESGENSFDNGNESGRKSEAVNESKETTKEPAKEKEIIMLSGHVHAREMATDLYILKQLADLLRKAEYDENVRFLLENVKIVAIPTVNPDGREIVYKSEKSEWKANAAGVDINRNFPSVNAGQRLWGIPIFYAFEYKPGPEEYAGPYLGSEPETKLMMQWFHKYAGYASYYIDYHQMGRAFFVGENWDLLSREEKKWADAEEMNRLYNTNLKDFKHREIYNGNHYGINGKGSCTTDYALSVALGMKYSEQYGRMTYKYNNQDLLLIMFRDLNEYKSYKPLNQKFVALTLEIGLYDSLGYTDKARASFAKEYYQASHDKYLTLLMEMALR